MRTMIESTKITLKEAVRELDNQITRAEERLEELDRAAKHLHMLKLIRKKVAEALQVGAGQEAK